jgi:hypothetical protein
MIKFGYAQEVITPPLGVQMAGFIGERKAEGVHDDLYAKSLYLETQSQKLMLCVLDTLALSLNFTQEVAGYLEENNGIPKENVLIAATHTHSGPEGLQCTTLVKPDGQTIQIGTLDSDLLSFTFKQTVKSAQNAILNAKEGSIFFDEGNFTERVFGNRRQTSDTEPLPTLKTLTFIGKDSHMGVLYDFGCHPTVLHEENHLISADFPGAVSSLIQRDISNITFSMFVNGAAGDMSTRFYRQKSSFDELERIATIMAQSIEKYVPGSEEIMLDTKPVWAKTVPIELKLKTMPTADVLTNMLSQAKQELKKAQEEGEANLRPWQSKVEGIESLIAESNLVDGADKVRTAFQIMQLGDVVFTAIPGELFSALGTQIENALNPLKVFVVGYAGDYIGYIPDMLAYDEGGYETLSTLLQKGEGERLVEAVIDSFNMGARS